ncbi:IS200/IS605 family accessory protein TnpB-related protein [Actinomadura nitritigenes]|uniref:IS200/IS605 family accessory protein TnpB-related protein n=1 Tax=Actinomadura nitritigenes TaxID=134602 RepID=UPI003D8C52FF
MRDRLKGLTFQDERVLRLVGTHLGRLAGRDLKKRCGDGLEHDAERWAVRKRELTGESSARWAGSITKATHDQWALARRGQLAHLRSLRAGVRTLEYRLSLPLGEEGTKRAPGGYRTKREWFAKSRRLGVLRDRRGTEWGDRVEADRAVAYRIHLDVERGRWYVTASWQRAAVPAVPMQAALARGVIGVDTNADHFAAWRLDRHGNPVGNPRRFGYDLSGPAQHRDAQVRHAITRLLRWASSCGVSAIGIEDLDFAAEKTREKHGRRKRFRQLLSGMPTGKLRARLVAMAAEAGIAIVAVDPAYTSRWGAQHWREPMSTPHRKVSRHDAASIAVGRRALGHPIRRRTAPPRHHQGDDAGPRAVQADRGDRGREGPRHPVTDRAHDAPRRTRATRTRATSVSSTVRDARRPGAWVQDPLL